MKFWIIFGVAAVAFLVNELQSDDTNPAANTGQTALRENERNLQALCREKRRVKEQRAMHRRPFKVKARKRNGD